VVTIQLFSPDGRLVRTLLQGHAVRAITRLRRPVNCAGLLLQNAGREYCGQSARIDQVILTCSLERSKSLVSLLKYSIFKRLSLLKGIFPMIDFVSDSNGVVCSMILSRHGRTACSRTDHGYIGLIYGALLDYRQSRARNAAAPFQHAGHKPWRWSAAPPHDRRSFG